MVDHVEAQSQAAPQASRPRPGRWRPLVVAALLATSPPASGTEAPLPPDCADLRWVTVDQVRINAGHVFCGELWRGAPTGFHSTALRESAARQRIVCPLQDPHPRGNGVYDARVLFRNGTATFSTLFPDSCDYHQVLRSIGHAFRHQQGTYPVWGVYGPSAPRPGATAYCVGENGAPLRVRLGLASSGARVNTAFPG